jgi:hypothetical protein
MDFPRIGFWWPSTAHERSPSGCSGVWQLALVQPCAVNKYALSETAPEEDRVAVDGKLA